MTTAAPGQVPTEREPACYNCGAKGHWMVACPEPTRDVPAGLQRWQSQHQDHGNHDRGIAAQEKKGPIITRYPPLALPQGTTVAPYTQPQPSPFPPGVPPPPPPPPPPGHGYPQPHYPPNPYAGSYPAPPPPPQYGHYPPGPPPPPQYGQQSPYGQAQYPGPYPPPANYYPPGSTPSPVPPPPPPPPGTFLPQQYGQPPPPPPPELGAYPPYPPAAPPPPGGYQYAPPQPQLYGAPAPSGPHFPPPPPPGWSPSQYAPPPPAPPPPAPSANQTPLGTHRGRHQKNHGSKRSHQHREKNRPGQDRHGKNTSRNERQERRASRDDPQTKAEEPQEQADEGDGNGDGGWDFESEEDMKHVFPDIMAKPADPVGIPLPIEYTEDPTIPPAYNATCVKSEFFQEDNRKEFGRSIRELRAWATVREDPAFKHFPGMVRRRFPDCVHEYPSYAVLAPPPPSSAIVMPPRYQVVRSTLKGVPRQEMRNQDRSDSRNACDQYRSSDSHRPRDLGRDQYSRDEREHPHTRKRSLDGSDRDDRNLKRSRWSQSRRDRSREGHNRAISPRRRSPSPKFHLEGDPWSPQAGESNFGPSSSRRHPETYNNAKLSPRDQRVSYMDKRHDSGYHSGQSLEKVTSRNRDDDRGHRPSDRSYRRRRSPSRSRSRSRSLSRSRGRSRASTPDRSGRSRSESPLTALEAELLGEIPSEPEPEPEPKPKPAVKKPIKRVQVAAAFSRRW